MPAKVSVMRGCGFRPLGSSFITTRRPGSASKPGDAGTIDAFVDHGTVARTVDADPASAQAVLDSLAEVGVDLDDVGDVLEDQGVASFAKAFDELIGALDTKAVELGSA